MYTLKLSFATTLIRSLASLKYGFSIIALAVRHSTSQKVCSVGRFFEQTIPGTPNCGCLTAFVWSFIARGRRWPLRLSPFGDFGGSLARLLQIHACFFVKCPAVFNLPERAVQIRSPIGVLEAATMLSHVASNPSCRRSWSFWALSSSYMASYATANSMSSSSVSCVTFFTVSSKISYSSRQGVQGLHGLLVKIVHFSVRLCVLLACGAPIVEETVQFPQSLILLPRNLSHSSRSEAFAFVSRTATASSSVPFSPFP